MRSTKHRFGSLFRDDAMRIALTMAVVLFNPALLRSQTEPSLGDVARQTRVEHTRAEASETSAAAQQANRFAAELEQEMEDGTPPPEGFEKYEANGYRFAMPSPFSVEGRDSNGILLASADWTGITTKVFAADPVPLSTGPNDLEFLALIQSFWKRYGSLTCDSHRPGTPEYSCSVTGNILANPFFGRARFIKDSDRIIPVICFAARMMSDPTIVPRNPTREEQLRMWENGLADQRRRSQAERSSQLCTAVLDSVRVRGEPGSSHSSTLRAHATTPLAQPAKGSTEAPSLGQIARNARQDAPKSVKAAIHVEDSDEINKAPAGFRARSTTRCGRECWKETVFIPENARRVTGGNSDNVYVANLDNDTSVTLYFETVDTENAYSERNAAGGVAYQWLHVQEDGFSKPLTSFHVVNGQQVPITRRRLAGTMKNWTEEVIVLENGTAKSTLGCITREDRFTDVEWICSTVFDSWRISRK